MTKSVLTYAQENAAKAAAAENAARERKDAHAAAYWHGYVVALDALIDNIARGIVR